MNSLDDKKLKRTIKNRISAETHRRKKREERERMIQKILNLEQKIEILEKENMQLRNENVQLKNLNFKSLPSPTLSKQSLDDIMHEEYDRFHSQTTDSMADFKLEDFVDFSGLEQKSLFSVLTLFMFGFASFLLPNYHFHATNQKLLRASAPLPTIDYFQDNLKDWHKGFILNPINSISLPTEEDGVLSFLQSKNPNSAKSLFTTGLNVDTALFPSCSKTILPTLIFQPFIRIVPLISEDDDFFVRDKYDGLKFSLFAHASRLGIDGSNGVLRLDLQVFRATWSEVESAS